MALEIYNTLTKNKEVFEPLQEGFVGMYVCGPTVYGHSHIGHAKSYVSFDVIVRYLRHLGYRVRYVQNITDVGHLTDDADAGEDKIGKQAAREQIQPMEVVETYTRSYFEDMDALGVQRPDISPRASGHITEQLAMVQTLIDKGHAYEANGSVYFDVSSFKPYGKLSGRKVEELMDAVRIDENSEKRSSTDFALWKRADASHLMQWPSPWGDGFPGWHLECSVMSTKYLGQPFDIHGGGLENVFPHHECEVAQSESCCSSKFANYWIHNNMVTVDGQKMGKSLGNAISLKEAFNGDSKVLSRAYEPLVIRFFILGSHYRSQLDFSDAALQAAEKGLQRLHSAVHQVRQQLTNAADGEIDGEVADIVARRKAEFTAAMDDDFNTPIAIGTLFEFNREVNTLLHGNKKLSAPSLQAIDDLYRSVGDEVLGIIPDPLPANEQQSDVADRLVGILADMRQEARQNRDWATADGIRDRLSAAGIVLEDGADGTTWRLQD